MLTSINKMSPLSHIALALLLLSCSVNSEDGEEFCSADPFYPGPWSCLLEEWAVSSPVENERQGRVMVLPPSPGYYVTDRLDMPPPPPPQHMSPPRPPGPPGPAPGVPGATGPKAYTEWQPPSGPGKIVNKPSQPYKDKPFRPSPSYPVSPNQYQPGPHYPQYVDPHRGPGPLPTPHPTSPPAPTGAAADRVDEPPRKQVTETDLYLLSAIEKLVYRVDLMEKRLRKLEENVHYIVAGVDHKPEPCVSNFTRVSGTCYHFSSEPVDWKSANLYCRKLRAHLLELDSEDERRKMFAAMLTDNKIRGKDIWTGGLNPGLLWIWSHSARPVLSNSTSATKVNVTSTSTSTSANDVTIVGAGRCLAAVYDPARNAYVYRGQDCSLRHRYICEMEDDKNKLSNEIQRVAKAMRSGNRQARELLTHVMDKNIGNTLDNASEQ